MELKKNLIIAGSVVGVIWAVFIINLIIPFDLRMFGIRPRQLSGLWGILFSPFLHAGLRHILANTLPLFILLLLALSYNRILTIEAIAVIMFAGGGTVWLVGGANTVHIGASGVIFGLIGFLLFAAIFQKNLKSLMVSLLVLFLYGGVLFSGFIPRYGVSWIGHASGFASGILAAWLAGAARQGKTS